MSPIDIKSEEQKDRCQTEKPIKTPTPQGLFQTPPPATVHTTGAAKPATDNIKTSRTTEIAKPNLKHAGDEISTPIRDCTNCTNILTALLG